MNSLSHLYVATRQNEMRAASASERLTRLATRPTARTPRHALGAALKSVWSLLSGPAERPMSLPSLQNYPYRG